MLNLGNILQLIIHRLNDVAFAQEQLVLQKHQAIFPIFAGFVHELNALFEQAFEETSG